MFDPDERLSYMPSLDLTWWRRPRVHSGAQQRNEVNHLGPVMISCEFDYKHMTLT